MTRGRVAIRKPNGKIVMEFAERVKTETASVKPPETAMLPPAAPKYLGGGWYAVDGRKVRKSELEEGD